MSDKRNIDQITGVETTSHVWDDDIKELNNPLPRWWLLTFYACILWAVGYWIAYPAWPMLSGYTNGVLGYSQRDVVAREVAAANQAQSGLRVEITKLPVAEILKNADLARFADAAGRTAFAENCAPCHGRGAQGVAGYPNLRDDDWLWGGKPDDILQTLRFGIRTDHKQTRTSQMPRYGLDKLLDDKQIFEVAEYVLSISGGTMAKESAARGGIIFKEQCAACHGDDGKGKPEQGAPNLTDQIWLYGNNIEAIVTSVRTGRGGVMPAWEGRLDPMTLKSLAVYVHSLGGGQ